MYSKSVVNPNWPRISWRRSIRFQMMGKLNASLVRGSVDTFHLPLSSPCCSTWSSQAASYPRTILAEGCLISFYGTSWLILDVPDWQASVHFLLTRAINSPTWKYIFGNTIDWPVGHGCSTAVELMPHDLEVMGSIPAGCWAFFFFFLFSP